MPLARLLRSHTTVCCLAVAALAAPRVLEGQQEVLTNDAIVQLTTAGVDPAVIVSTIETSRTRFQLAVSDIVALSKAKVNRDVIAAMQAASTRGGQPKNGAALASAAPALPREYGVYAAVNGEALPLTAVAVRAKTRTRGDKTENYLEVSNPLAASQRPIAETTPTFVVFTQTPLTKPVVMFTISTSLLGSATLAAEIPLRRGPVANDTRMQRVLPAQPLARGIYAILALDNPLVAYSFAITEGTVNPPRLEADVAAARTRAKAEFPLTLPLAPDAARQFVRQVLTRERIAVAREFSADGLLITRRGRRGGGLLSWSGPAMVQYAILVEPNASGGSAVYVAADAYTSGLPSGGMSDAGVDSTPLVASADQSRRQAEDLLKKLQKAAGQRR